jgi:hypothetical protein
MSPPKEAEKLIAYLFQLGTKIKLAKTNDEVTIEK